eukprot:Gregarina_sp_Poly_1__2936@NODE_181_length_11831_cov_65_262326_g161_i0_p6_GENE_NODE_181_length_11831_cov_65_262326_g161_i0NODE_181_length_11831_cov_65_262326_g161_i0_p6_ORF_typecomplete_len363_score63_70_NODE_181_length_11831_cov_65_262326_g161_i01261214
MSPVPATRWETRVIEHLVTLVILNRILIVMFVKALFLLLIVFESQAAPETTEPSAAPAAEDTEPEEEDDYGPFESLIKKCDGWEFPDDSFSKQPDNDKVYLRIDETSPGPFKDQNITQFASAFGIRVVGDTPVEPNKLQHVANIMAKAIDGDNDGKPDNKEMIEELLNFHPILFVMSDTDKVMELMNAQSADEGFPMELKFCPFAFDFEEAKKINPKGPRGDATCEEEKAKGKENNDRTLAFVLDHLMGRGFKKVMGEEKNKRLTEIYQASLEAGTFEPENTGCPPESEECGQVMLASWGLSTLLGFDQCWCEDAHALKFCDAETLKKGEEDLVELLEDIFPNAEEMDNSPYDPKDKAVVVK